jgi:two-component system OmpR family response regulator
LALRTFIVEDNAIVLNGLIEALVELAHVRIVGTAPSAATANEWLAEHRKGWDVAVVDLFLLASSGMDVLRSLRERGVEQRIIVLTNYATTEIRLRCMELGADAVFDKSTEIDELFNYFNDTPGNI